MKRKTLGGYLGHLTSEKKVFLGGPQMTLNQNQILKNWSYTSCFFTHTKNHKVQRKLLSRNHQDEIKLLMK